MKKRERYSGIELLRIVAACFVVILHYCNPQIGGAMKGATIVGGSNLLFLDVIRSLSCSAVDIFIIISGYFLINSEKRVIGKPIYLVFQVILLHLIVYLPKVILGIEAFTLTGFLKQFLITNYFVTLYVILYFLSPLINNIFAFMGQYAYRKSLLYLLIVFSVYPTLIDVIREFYGTELYGTSPIGRWGSQFGYNIVNFGVLYVLGGYLRKFRFPKIIYNHSILVILLCTVIILIWGKLPSALSEGASSARSYHNPVVIMLSVALFALFSKIKLHSSVINELAGAAFSCFLLHLLVIGRIHAVDYAQGSFIVLFGHLLASIIGIYAISYVFYKIYDFVVSPIIDYLNHYSLSFSNEGSYIIKQ